MIATRCRLQRRAVQRRVHRIWVAARSQPMLQCRRVACSGGGGGGGGGEGASVPSAGMDLSDLVRAAGALLASQRGARKGPDSGKALDPHARPSPCSQNAATGVRTSSRGLVRRRLRRGALAHRRGTLDFSVRLASCVSQAGRAVSCDLSSWRRASPSTRSCRCAVGSRHTFREGSLPRWPGPHSRFGPNNLNVESGKNGSAGGRGHSKRVERGQRGVGTVRAGRACTARS